MNPEELPELKFNVCEKCPIRITTQNMKLFDKTIIRHNILSDQKLMKKKNVFYCSHTYSTIKEGTIKKEKKKVVTFMTNN